MVKDDTTWRIVPDGGTPEQVPDEGVPWADYMSGNVQAADLAYVRGTWLESFYKSPWAGSVPNNLYHDVYTQAIDQLIARGSKLLLIKNPANPELLVAWVCYEITPKNEVVIHYAFTKPTYRKAGACRALLAKVMAIVGAERFFYTFRTSNSRFFTAGTFRPEIARRRETRATAVGT